jgi:CRP-like cAMP-binding protein
MGCINSTPKGALSRESDLIAYQPSVHNPLPSAASAIQSARESSVAGGKPSSFTLTAEQRVAAAMRSKKRAVVTSEAVDMESAFTPRNIPKSPESRLAIRGALRNHFLFSGLDEQDQEHVVNAMAERRLETRLNIITQGDTGDHFYIVERGTFDILVNGIKVGSVGPGGSFGELALLYNCPRAATVVCTAPAVLWVLDRITFRYTLARTAAGGRDECLMHLRRVQLLQSLTDAQLMQIVDAVQIVHFTAGERIITKGEAGTVFYMIKSGSVTVTDMGARANDIELRAGEFFGERALLLGEPRAATVVAKTNTALMALDRDVRAVLLPSCLVCELPGRLPGWWLLLRVTACFGQPCPAVWCFDVEPPKKYPTHTPILHLPMMAGICYVSGSTA